MTLLDHYLRAVRIYLPKNREQDDIISELSEHLTARIEEEESERGRPLTDNQQEALLLAYGDPATVASRYGASNRGLAFGRQLIGPGLFPLYVRILAFQVALSVIVQLLLAAIGRGPRAGVFGILWSLAAQFVLLTVIFTIIEILSRSANDHVAERWRFPLPHRQEVPRWQSIAGAILHGTAAIWWALLPAMPSLLLAGYAERVEFSAVWAQVYWPVLLLLLLSVTQRLVSAQRPDTNFLQAVTRVVTNGGALAIAGVFLLRYPYFDARADVVDPVLAARIAERLSTTLGWNLALALGLYWLITGGYNVWLCAQHLGARSRQRERRLAAAILAVATAGTLLGGTASAQTPPASSGARLFQDRCATCHDAGGRVPTRAALGAMAAANLRQALESGVMKTQGEQLTPAERDLVIAFLAAPAANAGASANACASGPLPSTAATAPQWNGWGGLTQRRYQTSAMAGVSANDLPKLSLKWAFAFPGVRQAFAQPAIVGGRLFVGSAGRKIYALDARSGCQHWTFDAEAPVRAAMSTTSVGPAWTAFAGDQRGTVYALDAATGALRWKRRVDDHPNATITGAPTLSGNTLYVPVSSSEEGIGADPRYECCTFRGSVVALDAATGEVKWKAFTIPTPPAPTRKNSQGTQLWGPSGAAIWSSPTVDARLSRVYVTTGDSYSDPAADTSDAFLAFDAITGALIWSRQLTKGDAFNVACDFPEQYRINCPQAQGPDFDFGSSPMLIDLPGGGRALVAGQKSGVVHALDPDRGGELLWQTTAGKGGRLGGVQWGGASDGDRIYIALSDVAIAPAAAGTPGAQPSSFGAPMLFDERAGGGLVALDPTTGAVRWRTPHPGCGGVPGCSPGQSAAVTSIPGVVFSGGVDGHLRAYAPVDGRILWDQDTKRDYQSVNGVAGRGGALDGPGAVVVDGILYVNSGYAFAGGAPGNVLLAFSVDGK